MRQTPKPNTAAFKPPATPTIITDRYVQAPTPTPLPLPSPPAATAAGARRLLTAPGRLSVYLANALANAFLHDTFWLPTKLSTATAMARSMSCPLQYSLRRILAKASLVRRMDSRWRTCGASTLAGEGGVWGREGGTYGDGVGARGERFPAHVRE